MRPKRYAFREPLPRPSVRKNARKLRVYLTVVLKVRDLELAPRALHYRQTSARRASERVRDLLILQLPR